uniref:histone acetyltransferase n=1 Tax=Panagrolaimus superbus TaxID=310955 RepID=A0A914YAK7_9BILA
MEEEIPQVYLSEKDIIDQAPPEHAKILKAHFEEEDNIMRKKLEESSGGVQPQPKYIYISGKQMEIEQKCVFFQNVQLYDTLFVCEQCVEYFSDRDTLDRHYKCCIPNPLAGKEIYRDREKKFVIREADGFYDSSFSNRLCQIGRCFIGHKQLQYDIEPFSFYVLYEITDDNKYRFVGYFSKQKYQHTSCNLCCLLVLPCFQGKGYGRLLIDFSFLLSKTEHVPGGPEFPLSESADHIYYKYVLESIYEATFNVCYEELKKGTKIENVDLNLLLFQSLTGIAAKLIVKVLLEEKIMKVKKSKAKVEFKFDWEIILNHMEKQKSHPNRIFLHDEYLQWGPQELYVYEELLHFPEIEEERIRNSRGDNTMPEHEREKDIPGHHIFYHGDTNEQFDKRNKDLCASRSRIFVSKNGEKGAQAENIEIEFLKIQSIFTLKFEHCYSNHTVFIA